jgi:hypothetical protein
MVRDEGFKIILRLSGRRQLLVQFLPHQIAGAMEPRLDGGYRDVQSFGRFRRGQVVYLAHLIDFAILCRQGPDRLCDTMLKFFSAQFHFCPCFLRQLNSIDKPYQRDERLLPLDAAANAPSDDGEPSLEGFFIAKAIFSFKGGNKSLDENIFGVFTIATDADHLAVDGVFVPSGKTLIVH